jgi:hypothetical protein
VTGREPRASCNFFICKMGIILFISGGRLRLHQDKSKVLRPSLAFRKTKITYCAEPVHRMLAHEAGFALFSLSLTRHTIARDR